MTIPASIIAEETNLQTQVMAATPLNAASHASIKAMQLNADQLVTDVQTALTPTTSILDTYNSTDDVPATIASYLTIVQAAEDQTDLSLLRGISGRVALNLAQFG